MNNWCEYWANARLVKTGKNNSFRLLKENDSLDFFVDERKGRTQGMIYLFAVPGSKGSTMAQGEEASFLESVLQETK